MRPKRLLVLSALAAASLSFGPATPAQAYTSLGCKFSTPSLKWENATTTSGYAQSAIDSLNSWGRTNTPVSFTGVSKGANVRIANGNFGPVGYDGITKDANGNVPPACSNGRWSVSVVTWWNSYYADAYPAAKRRSVMAHEVGHALGLAHTGANSCANVPLMQPDTQTRYDVCVIVSPKSDDINGVNALY